MDLRDLIAQVPAELEQYLPNMRYSIASSAIYGVDG